MNYNKISPRKLQTRFDINSTLLIKCKSLASIKIKKNIAVHATRLDGLDQSQIT